MITGCSSSNDDSDILVELPIYNEGNFSQQSGAIFIDIHVGGNPYRVLFDTGSSTQNDVLNNPNIAPKNVLQQMGDKYLGGGYMPFALV